MRMAAAPPSPASFSRLYVQGPLGTGKTGMALQRLAWLQEQLPAEGPAITVLVPSGYALRQLRRRAARNPVRIASPYRLLTFFALMRGAVDLAWPVIAERCGYVHQGQEPTFLNLETSQYILAEWVDEMVTQGQFEAVLQDRHFTPHRLITQVLDNMTKAAMYRYPLAHAYERLMLAVPEGKFRQARLNVYRNALALSRRFLRHCRTQGLVSQGLLYHLFYRILEDEKLFDALLLARCRHVVVDGCEEQDYACHQFLQRLIPQTESSLCLADPDGGLRYFLGAYREGLADIARLSDVRIALAYAPATGRTRTITRIRNMLDTSGVFPIQTATCEHTRTVHRSDALDLMQGHTRGIFHVRIREHFAELLKATAEESRTLVVEQGVLPSQIVILAPIVSNALRFSLEKLMAQRGLRLYVHRPSRKLEDEPAAQALLALACLAHPQWGLWVDEIRKRIALLLALEGLEGWRAPGLAQIWQEGRPIPFAALQPDFQERMQSRHGVRYDALREWLHRYQGEEHYWPLDIFFARLHDELLGLPGFGFRTDANALRVAHQLMRSARTFRELAADFGMPAAQEEGTVVSPRDPGRAWVRLVRSGLIGNLYLPADAPPADAVVLSSTYNFMMQDYSAEHQFWLDINHTGWGQRLYQPLTHPYVLSPSWPASDAWTDWAEHRISQLELGRLLVGLLHRTGHSIHLGLSIYGEHGHNQQGPLLRVINRLLTSDTEAPSPD